MDPDSESIHPQVVGVSFAKIDAFDVTTPTHISDAKDAESSETIEAASPTVQKSQQLKALCCLCVGIFSALSVWFVASAVLVPLKRDWLISNAEGSFLTSMVNVGFCVGCMCSAVSGLTDLVPAPVLILIGSLGAAASNACMLVVRGLSGALVVRFFVGLFLCFVYPPGTKLLCTWFAAHQRATAIGVMFGAFCLGSASPQLLNGVASSSWQLLVLSTSGASAVSGLLIYMCVPVGPFKFPSSRFDAKQFINVLRNRNLVLVTLAYCGHMWELFCVWAWLPLFLENTWQISASASPAIAFFIISMGGPGSWIGGLLGDRIGRVSIAAASLAISGICIAGLGTLSSEGPIALRICLALLWGLAALADSPNYAALITVHAEQEYVGTAVTTQLFCGYMITVLALWVVPSIAASISWRWSMALLAVGPLVGLLALFGLKRRQVEN